MEERMQKRVFGYIREYQMIEGKDRVIAGVSGGADSICMLHMLIEFQKEIPFALSVVHINHELREEEAAKDAEFVEQICREYDIPCKVFSYDVAAIAQDEKLSIEEAGRKVRYQAFEKYAVQWGGTKIALAHHKNDVAETMLHNLVRGSALTGLCSVHPIRNPYIRPLLCMNREEIEQYLKDRHILWRTDSSNQDIQYTRNKIRHRVVDYLVQEINPKAVEHMADTAEDLLAAEEYLCQEALRAQEFHGKQKGNSIWLSQFLTEEASIIRRYVLRNCFEQIAGSRKNLSRKHLQEMDELFGKTVGKSICLPLGVTASRVYQGIKIETTKEAGGILKAHAIAAPIPIPGEYSDEGFTIKCQVFPKNEDVIPEKRYTKWFDYDKIKGNLVIRTRKSGDFLVVDRSGGKKKLKDYFIDIKVPQEERDAVLLLTADSEIIWVIGMRISEKYKIDKNTGQILSVQIKGRNIHE